MGTGHCEIPAASAGMTELLARVCELGRGGDEARRAYSPITALVGVE